MWKYRRKLSWLCWLWMTTKIKHLYIHVPFCKAICYYCDFARRIYDEKLADKWLERLEKEISDSCHEQYETIYIGGGTPSCLSLEQSEKLLNLIYPYASEVKEYTIEANPESLDSDKILLYKQYGINRISLGVQSCNDELLKSLNRKHDFKTVEDKISLLRNHGLDNISVDLMYSLPGQNMDILKDTLYRLINLDLPHLSLYSLTIEDNSVFGKKGIKALDEDTEADMYELIDEILRAHDYIHYEVSNYAKAGYPSKHNLGYWNYDDYLGLSAGASGKISNNRYTNTRDLQRYIKSDDIREEDLYLSRKDQMFENVMMSLRTIYGLDLYDFEKRYGISIQEAYPRALKNRNLMIRNDRLICTNLEILNSVLLDFMD